LRVKPPNEFGRGEFWAITGEATGKFPLIVTILPGEIAEVPLAVFATLLKLREDALVASLL
jgi:hypothetical protein